MSIQLEYKNSYCLKGICLLISLLISALLLPTLARVHKTVSQVKASSSSPSKTRIERGGKPDRRSAHTIRSLHLSSNYRRRKHHAKIAHKKISPEEIAATRKEQARQAEENRFNQSRNSTIIRAYQLYDSGTNEFLLGNYKYSMLQLKLANQLLTDHGEENSALDIATLTALASSAKVAGDWLLARSTYEKLLLMNPQDIFIGLQLARLQAANGDFHAAQINVNRVINFKPDNQEALQLCDLINNRSKTSSTK